MPQQNRQPNILDWFNGGAQQPSGAAGQQQPQTLADWYNAGAAPTKRRPQQQPQQNFLEQPEPEKELPAGAIGFTEDGDPYFGDGISGILRKWAYNYTKDVKDVSDEDWQDLFNRWKALQSTPVEEVGGAERLQLLGEAVSKLWQEGTKDESLLSPVLKATGATTQAVLDLFSLPAKRLEQGLGALAGFREAADEVESPLPKLDGVMESILYANPIFGVAYDVTRIALSPSEDKWQKTQKAIEEGWHAGRIFYSTLFDHTLKEQFLQEYRQGKDPELIAMKLENPLAEFGGQFLLDPLTLVGAFAKAAKSAKQLNVALNAVTESGLLRTEAGKAALKAIQDAVDDHSAIRALDQLTAAQRQVVQNVTRNSKLLNVGFSADSLTTTSRQNAIVSKGKDLLGNMALVLKSRGMSYDAIAEAILAGVRSVSDNVDDMRRGLAVLAKLPNANMWLADDYVETFSILKKMMSNADGVIDGGDLRRLMDVKNPAEFADEAKRLFLKAAEGEYKSVTELRNAYRMARGAKKAGGEVTEETARLARQYEELPAHVKFLNDLNEKLEMVTSPINRVLFPSYFNLQGGVAVRNVIGNAELSLIDMGKGVLADVTDGKIWTNASIDEFLVDVFGDIPTSAKGFESLVQASTGHKAWGFGKLMEAGEEAFAKRIVAASVRDTFKKMLPKAMPNLVQEMEAGIITERQVRMLTNLLHKNHYNLGRAIEEFRNIYRTGSVEDWRNLDFVTQFEREALENLDLWKEIQALAVNGADSTDEVEAVFQRLNDIVDGRAAKAVNDPIGISPDHPGIESWGDLAKAAQEGHLDPDRQQLFTAVMESAEQARLEYQTLLDDVALKATQALNREGRFEEAARIGQEMNRIRDTLRKAAPATAREAREITADAWRWTEAVRRLKKPTFEDLAAYWKRAGLEGEPPLDLDRKKLLRAIWEQRFNRVSELWNSSLDAVVGESETVLKQMEGVIDTAELQSMATRTRWITKQAQAIRQGTFQNGALKIIPREDIEAIAKKFNVTTDEILNAINTTKGTQYRSIDEVPTRDIAEWFRRAHNADLGIAIPPPHPVGTMPTAARAWNESARGAKYVLDNIKNGILERWGKTNAERVANAEMDAVLQKIVDTLEPRIAEIRLMAARIAAEQRKFTLLDYSDKRYFDVALAKILPFHFFYTRSYKNWLYRIAQNPEIVAGYARLRGYLEEINRDAPEWYKYQLNINPFAGDEEMEDKTFLGIPLDHPLYINLEATFNPLYGLTGVDYYDPVKRQNWVLATIDDMSKFGPTMYAPIQLGIAAILFQQGEQDVAARWAGRLFPQTTQIKGLTNQLFGKPIELDPAVNFFSDGIDTQERNRMAYAAAQLIQSGQFTAEQVMLDFQAQEGPAWDAAYQLATQSRFASSVTSYFLGVGFKPRSANDVMVEEMYEKLNKLYALADMMPPEEYRMAWEQLRSMYPDGFVDSVLLARKGGEKRDAALAYEVLNRIPPGNMSEALATIGLSYDEINKFYESKGFTDSKVKWTKQEKDRFMAAVLDLAAMLKIPDAATREEWTAARTANSAMYEAIQEEFGEDIWDKVSHYYDLKDDNYSEAQLFTQMHPEVFEALQRKREYIVSDPLLAAYYGGIETIEAYIDGRVRQELSDLYGPDIYDIQSQYYNATDQRSFLRQHPELRAFWADKRRLEEQYEPMFYQFAQALPDIKGAQFQKGFAPQSYTQEQLFEALQPQERIPSWEEVSAGMAEWLQQEIAAYAEAGVPLSKRAQNQLDYLAEVGGYYDADELLRFAVLSLQMPLESGQQQSSLLDWFNS